MIKIIKEYLAQHKRLIIPQLGAFIVKADDGGVVFSEMMRRDDGVLRGLIIQKGVNELEAAGEIDRFVFEVRHAVECGKEHVMAGFGVMYPGANSTIAFRYDTSAGEGGAQPVATQSRAAVQRPALQTRHVVRPAEKSAEKPAERPAEKPAEVADAPQEASHDARQPHLTDSVKMNPDPSVRGLRYGKPPKTTNAYTYVDKPPRRRTALGDVFIWVGIIVAAIALSAIAFGYWRDMQDRRVADEYFEQITSDQFSGPDGELNTLEQQ